MATRTLVDLLLTKTVALPASATTVNGTSIDLGDASPELCGEHSEFVLTVPATPSLANAATLIYTVQDSADNSSFAAVGTLAVFTSTGGGGTGAVAVSNAWRLPSNVRRYVRVSVIESAAGGDNSAVSMVYGLQF